MAGSPLSSLAALHKALAHPARLRILAAVRGGELCVCQLTALLELAPSTVSAHLAELRSAGLLAERREGRWVYYRLAEPQARPAATLLSGLETDPTVAADAEAVQRLRAIPVEEFCALDTQQRALAALSTDRAPS